MRQGVQPHLTVYWFSLSIRWGAIYPSTCFVVTWGSSSLLDNTQAEAGSVSLTLMVFFLFLTLSGCMLTKNRAVNTLTVGIHFVCITHDCVAAHGWRPECKPLKAQGSLDSSVKQGAHIHLSLRQIKRSQVRDAITANCCLCSSLSHIESFKHKSVLSLFFFWHSVQQSLLCLVCFLS